jgi:hypothetical protein
MEPAAHWGNDSPGNDQKEWMTGVGKKEKPGSTKNGSLSLKESGHENHLPRAFP